MNKFIQGHLESLDQLVTFIESLDEADYQYIAEPWFVSSIGEHLRHIVDLYLAMMNSADLKNIDYDVKRRGSPIEASKKLGLSELVKIRLWLCQISIEEMQQDILISTETALSFQHAEVFKSSFGRELCFASSHLMHHLAIMGAIAKLAGIKVDPTLGLAPATATHVRESAF